MPRSLLARLLLPALVLTLVAACMFPRTGTNDDPSVAPPRTTSAPPSDPAGTEVDGTTTFAEFQSDLGVSVQTAENYWTSQFRASGLTFRPIQQVLPYQRDGELSCGSAPVPRNNALYCPQGDFIAYDIAWAFGSFQTVGDAFLYFLLGHEYAHGIQARLGITHQFTIDNELQADCMAGALLGDAERAKQIRIAPGDLEEFESGLAAVADDPNQPWFADGAHGSVDQRTNSFFAGYRNSISACDLS